MLLFFWCLIAFPLLFYAHMVYTSNLELLIEHNCRLLNELLLGKFGLLFCLFSHFFIILTVFDCAKLLFGPYIVEVETSDIHKPIRVHQFNFLFQLHLLLLFCQSHVVHQLYVYHFFLIDAELTRTYLAVGGRFAL